MCHELRSNIGITPLCIAVSKHSPPDSADNIALTLLSNVNPKLQRNDHTVSKMQTTIAIMRFTSFKLLGVLLSNDVTWDSHVDYVLNKANSRRYALRKQKRTGLSQLLSSYRLLLNYSMSH